MIRNFNGIWPSNCLVVDVETLHLMGEDVPLTFGLASVVSHKLAATCHRRIDWSSLRTAANPRPSDRDLEQALAGGCTHRPLTLPQLKVGEPPYYALETAHEVLTAAAGNGTLVVTHRIEPGLPALFNAIENWLDVDLPPLSVLSTAILEGARREGHRPRPGESDGSFYERMLKLRPVEPALQSCREGPQGDGGPPPDHRLFGVMATYALYRRHREGRLFRGLGATSPPGEPSTPPAPGHGRSAPRSG